MNEHNRAAQGGPRTVLTLNPGREMWAEGEILAGAPNKKRRRRCGMNEPCALPLTIELR